jgi:two-component system cell cycle sensor histidine kinase/response regulator CckA
MPQPADNGHASRSVATVLVVDDQDLVRDVVRIALEEAGYRVLIAASPLPALELVEHETDIDLLLVDIVMPEMDAFELTGKLSAALPGVEVLYMSGYTDAREEGHFIQKPFSPSQLVATVESILAGR